jgi:hypothetical protein
MIRIIRKTASRIAALYALQYVVMSVITGTATAIVVQWIGESIASRFDAINTALKKMPF